MGEIVRGAEKHFHEYPGAANNYVLGTVYKCSCGQRWVLTNQRYQDMEGDFSYENQWEPCDDDQGGRWFDDPVPDPARPGTWYRRQGWTYNRVYGVRLKKRGGNWIKE